MSALRSPVSSLAFIPSRRRAQTPGCRLYAELSALCAVCSDVTGLTVMSTAGLQTPDSPPVPKVTAGYLSDQSPGLRTQLSGRALMTSPF
ncbi:hypothetical protein AAFF_G00270900 [Aldrovandia affinis]|uniref:Uncharacterized protein n=1 Tax=Aldrovandia affinis TaxID=143900 RepID=A0AAD7W1M5_9TELE|nr:hypothetical protein AAFF_G00270900 [Aldrovandia affinis]